MRIRIEYCAVWGYADRAVGLAAEILAEMEHSVTALELVPGKGGVFEVDVDGDRVYSKKATGRHGAPGEILGLVRAKSADGR